MPRGIGIVLYGGEGLGKTSWAAQWANIGPTKVLSVGEIGYDDLEMVGDIPEGCRNVTVSSFEELDKECVNLEEDVLVIDSMKGVETILFDFVCKRDFNGQWNGKDGFTSYYKGQRVNSPPTFDVFLNRLSGLLAAGKHVIIIGHMITVNLPNTMGADYLSHVIYCDEGIRGCLMRWAPNVFFMNINVDITRSTESSRNVVMKGKANDTDVRVLYTIKSPGHAAKNKLRLPPVIPMGDSAHEGFNNFIKHLPEKVRNGLA